MTVDEVNTSVNCYEPLASPSWPGSLTICFTSNKTNKTGRCKDFSLASISCEATLGYMTWALAKTMTKKMQARTQSNMFNHCHTLFDVIF